jgi:hypothetical protein
MIDARKSAKRLALACLFVLAPVVTSAQSGHIAGTPGRITGVVIGAPHGTADANTVEIAEAIAKRTGAGLVTATGFMFRDRDKTWRLDVNRPSEGLVAGGEEHESDRSAAAYGLYRIKVQEAAAGPLRLYVEIHGNSRPESGGQVEIATVGVDAALAERLRGLLEAAQAAHPTAPQVRVLIEPADPIYFRASAAKRGGILTLPERALHLEIPRAGRGAAGYDAVLAEFVAAALPLLTVESPKS